MAVSIIYHVQYPTVIWPCGGGSTNCIWNTRLPEVECYRVNSRENGRQAAVLEGSRKIALFTPSSSQGPNLREIFLDSDARSIGLSNDAQKLAVGLKNGEIRLYFLAQPDRAPIGRSIINVEIASVAFTSDG